MHSKDVHADHDKPDQTFSADLSVTLDLEMDFLKQSDGVDRVIAEAAGVGLLRVQVHGSEGAIRTVTARTLAGPIDAVLQVAPCDCVISRCSIKGTGRASSCWSSLTRCPRKTEYGVGGIMPSARSRARCDAQADEAGHAHVEN
ncbi:hypothetical protein [Pseudorhodoferax soli]|uniref:hypothetical protein n=1 Tax=Pseudorhodoferax soli TaxID=545864 RepID=UPI001B85D734|nr:hypothetical protein [Pseudorhodoferax soli]